MMAFRFFFSAGEETKDKTQFSALIEKPGKKPGSFGEWVWSQTATHTCLTFDRFLNLPKYIRWEYLRGVCDD